jgi:hypothetical protein
VVGNAVGRGFAGGAWPRREPLAFTKPPLSGEEDRGAGWAERGTNCEAILSSNEVAFVNFLPAQIRGKSAKRPTTGERKGSPDLHRRVEFRQSRRYS